jgi:hypothetical protein
MSIQSSDCALVTTKLRSNINVNIAPIASRTRTKPSDTRILYTYEETHGHVQPSRLVGRHSIPIQYDPKQPIYADIVVKNSQIQQTGATGMNIS